MKAYLITTGLVFELIILACNTRMKRFGGLFVFTILCGCAAVHTGANGPRPAQAPAVVEDDISAYFSPGGGAMAAILLELHQAQRSIDVNAYLITAPEIADALKAAAKRGVKVRIILDKNGIGGRYSSAAYFSDGSVPVWRDGKHKDAHNKVMLIDGRTIITGSFNFTDQSEDTNAENVLIIRNKPKLFTAYEADFEKHLSHSDPP